MLPAIPAIASRRCEVRGRSSLTISFSASFTLAMPKSLAERHLRTHRQFSRAVRTHVIVSGRAIRAEGALKRTAERIGLARHRLAAFLALVLDRGHHSQQRRVLLLALCRGQQRLARFFVLFLSRERLVDSRAPVLEPRKYDHDLASRPAFEQRRDYLFRCDTLVGHFVPLAIRVANRVAIRLARDYLLHAAA